MALFRPRRVAGAKSAYRLRRCGRLALTIVMWFILNRHKFGESVMFIGDNANVARVMGVNVEVTRIQVFTLMGAIAAFAGVILTMEMGVFYPTQGQGMLLPVMAAVFIGGTSMAGGVGVIVGTFFGSYVIGSLEAGVVATGVSGFWTQLVQGLVMGRSIVHQHLDGAGPVRRARRTVPSLGRDYAPGHGQRRSTPIGPCEIISSCRIDQISDQTERG